MPRRFQIPSYRLHRPSGRAVVTLNDVDHYLGAHGSPESRIEYERLIAEWLARHQTAEPDYEGMELPLAEVMLAYLESAATYYRDAEGNTTREFENIKNALRPLGALYSFALAKDFGPIALKAVRQKMIDDKLCRRVVNQRIGIIKRMFKWASSEQLIPPAIYHGLQCVDGLKRGRSQARETEPVTPVPDAHVDATLKFLPPTLNAMVQLQRNTGMRSGELVLMRGIDIDTTGTIWIYRPQKHKTQHHGHSRTVMLGPQAKEIIQPFFEPDLTAYLFSPSQAQAERDEEKRKNRKTKVQPSQVCRKKGNPKKQKGERYDRCSYYRAISYAIKKARKAGLDVPDWHPHQLRHNAATRIRKERGLDAARAVLGHRSLAITDTYAEIDQALAAKVAAEMG
jgi:integrase